MSNPSKEQINEIKAFVEGVLHGKVITENMGNCKRCGKYDDLRMGFCFDCVFKLCPRKNCPFRQLVYNVKRERVWRDLTFTDLKGKIHCDRTEGVCSDQEYAVTLEKAFPVESDEEDRKAIDTFLRYKVPKKVKHE